MTPREPRTLGEIAARNLHADGHYTTVRAVTQGAKVCVVIWSWAVTTRKLGRRPTVWEHIAEWKMSERQAYLELALVRKAFPKINDPQVLVDWLLADAEKRAGQLVDRFKVSGLPAPRLVLR